jgi:hypothetical protein
MFAHKNRDDIAQVRDALAAGLATKGLTQRGVLRALTLLSEDANNPARPEEERIEVGQVAFELFRNIEAAGIIANEDPSVWEQLNSMAALNRAVREHALEAYINQRIAASLTDRDKRYAQTVAEIREFIAWCEKGYADAGHPVCDTFRPFAKQKAILAERGFLGWKDFEYILDHRHMVAEMLADSGLLGPGRLYPDNDSHIFFWSCSRNGIFIK